MNWASSRKVIYAFVVLVALVLLGVYGFRDTLFPKATCNDMKQNGYEEGIDCGGLCARKCVDQITPIQVLWARALPVSPGIYDLAGMLSNRNLDSVPITFAVTFTVYNANREVIYSQKIDAVPPSTGDIPVMIQNVKFSEEPKNVIITVEEGTYYKISPNFQTVQISVTNVSFENGDIPRAYVTIRNVTRNRFINFPVRVVLYDADQNAIGVGQSFVESLDKQAEKSIPFTWKSQFLNKPVVYKAYPILSPFPSN